MIYSGPALLPRSIRDFRCLQFLRVGNAQRRFSCFQRIEDFIVKPRFVPKLERGADSAGQPIHEIAKHKGILSEIGGKLK